MEIVKRENGNQITLSVSGIINTETAKEFNKELLALDYQGMDLTLDFDKTEYITSAGLRALLVARKKLTESTMRIINVNSEIMEIMETTGFDQMIPVSAPAVAAVPEENYHLSIAALLKKRLEEGEDDTAYVFRGRNYTWKDIEIASHIIAADLARNNVKKGTHVGICSVNSINWIFTFFAIQKLGAIAVLINPALHPSEVNVLAEISDLTHLCYAEIPGMTTFEMYREVCTSGKNIRYMYDISNSIDFTARCDKYEAIKENYREKHYADDPSVVIFSSGTTGRPKAILSSSYNLLASVEPLITGMDLSKKDINLAFLPLFHIFGFATGISVELLTGYYSVIPEGKSPAAMIDYIEKYRCTIFNTVPTMILGMIQMPNFTPEKLETLRISVLGGSATTEEQMKKLQQLMPNNHFGNIYGMSENAAVSLTGYGDTVEHITRTIGKPVPGLELVIRDLNTGEEVSQGEKGEICVRSDTMATCYYKLPIEKQPVDDEGWLATGDIGFLDNEGYLHITGRTKELIICGGENISPGEIAEVIAVLPEVADVKVLGIPHEIRGEVVAAAVILKKDAVWDEEKARAFLSERLSRYKVPTHFGVFESFPLLGSGKVDVLTLKKQMTEMIQSK